MRRQIVMGAVCAAMLAGCKVGPNYKRPDVAAPPQFRAADATAQAPSLGEAKWFDIFQDDVLRGLIKEAIQANYDVRIAAQRVLESEGQLAVTRAAVLPQLNAQGSGTRQGSNSPTQSTLGVFGAVSWELDLFGKLRRANEAQRANLLASKENQAAVLQALVAQVASAYFNLREYDLELEYVNASLTARKDSLRLVKARQVGGVGTMLEVDQSTSLVAAAQGNAAQLERAVEQTENLIQFLLGKAPGQVVRGKPLSEQAQPPAVPAGLPSELLARRPDLRVAEQQLVAANARVGAAKALFFPSISLTAGGGYQTTELFGLISKTGPAYSLGGTVDLPIFDAGRRVGNYKVAQAQKEQLVIGYQKAVNQAFREVSDALIGYQKSKEFRAQQELFANTLRDQSRLSGLRYRGGVTSYLEVLDTERQRLAAEQQLAQARRDELVSLVTLYKALGGGWQQ